MDRNERFLQRKFDFVHHKRDQSEKFEDHRGNDASRLPRMYTSTPGQAHKEDNETGREEGSSGVVEFLDELQLPCRAMLHAEGWGMVEEVPTRKTRCIADDPQVVAPPPAGSGVDDECTCSGGTKAGKGHHPQIAVRVTEKPVFHRHQFSHGEGELQRADAREADENLTTDERGNVLGLCRGVSM